MSELYDRQFKIGFALTVGVFLLGNVISYVRALQHYYAIKEELQFNQFISYIPMPNWGFPFPFWGYSSLIFEDGSIGLALNFTAAIIASFAIGLLFKLLFKRRPINNSE
jgi:hypothetical protein